MDNVLIDDRRIHVDFSQSVAKLHQWNREGKDAPQADVKEEPELMDHKNTHRREMERRNGDEEGNLQKEEDLQNLRESEARKEEDGRDQDQAKMTCRKNFEEIGLLKNPTEGDQEAENEGLEKKEQEVENEYGRSREGTDQIAEINDDEVGSEDPAALRDVRNAHVPITDRVHH
ncbi:unnamed protein product, partial [Strongylus vulgaris]